MLWWSILFNFIDIYYGWAVILGHKGWHKSSEGYLYRFLSLFLSFVLHRLLQFFSSFLWPGQPATSYRPSVCANNSPVTSEFCISVGSWSWNNSNTKHWGCSSCARSELNASARVGHCTCFSTSQCCSEDASKSTASCWPEEACWAYASSFTTGQVSFGWNPKLSLFLQLAEAPTSVGSLQEHVQQLANHVGTDRSHIQLKNCMSVLCSVWDVSSIGGMQFAYVETVWYDVDNMCWWAWWGSSKKQKLQAGEADQSIDQLNDVTAVSGVNLRVGSHLGGAGHSVAI